MSENFEEIVVDFINTVYLRYSNGQKIEAIDLFTHSKECNATHIGYSSGKSRGTGVSKEMLDQFFNYVMNSTQQLRKKLLTPVSLTLFIKHFSKDRMSDLLISILKKELISFSLEQAKNHGLTISQSTLKFEYWNVAKHDWDTFESRYVLDDDEKELILLPKEIVNYRYLVTPGKYVSTIFSYFQTLNEYQNADNQLLSKKIIREREITNKYASDKEKTYIQDITYGKPELFGSFYDDSLQFRSYKSLTDEELIKSLTTS